MSRNTLFNTVLQNFKPTLLVPALTAGLIAGVLAIILQISFATLIFSGDLSPYLGKGIGLMLFSGFVIALVVALTSSFPVSIGSPQDSPAVILALIATSISTFLSESRNTSVTFATIIAAVTVTTLLTGAFFFLLGQFQLGRFIRYIPFPVVGGFLAGTGWLLMQGGLSAMTGQQVTFDSLYYFTLPLVVIRWLPGVVLAVVLLVVLRRWSHALVFPSILLAAIALFYLALPVLNVSISEVRDRSWLLGPFPSGGCFNLQPLRRWQKQTGKQYCGRRIKLPRCWWSA